MQKCVPGGYCTTEVTKKLQELFASNLAAINAKLHKNWATVFVNHAYSQVVAGTNYLGFVTGGNGDKATVTIFYPLSGSGNDPQVTSA